MRVKRVASRVNQFLKNRRPCWLNCIKAGGRTTTYRRGWYCIVGADAVAKREAGADLGPGVYTGSIYQGPALIKDVGEALVRYNRQNHRPGL